MQSSSAQDSQTIEDRLLEPLLNAWLDEIKSLAANQVVKVFITYAWPKRGEEEGIHDFLKRLRRHLMHAGIEVWLDHYTMGNNPGVSPDRAMRDGIAQANVILMMGTETYQQRSAQSTNVKLEVDCIQAELTKGETRGLKVYPLLYRGDFGNSFPKAIYPNGPQDIVMDCREGQAAYDYYKYTLPSLAITLLGRGDALQKAYEKHEQAIIKRREELVPSTVEGAKFHLQQTHEKNAEITMLFGGTWRLNDKGRYVNLAIIEEQQQKTQEKPTGEERDGDRKEGESSASSQSNVREQHLASFETIYAAKKSVELEKLWETKIQSPGRASDNSGPIARFLMALGRAGVGKSTCCKYIALMHTQLWSGKFDFVFLVPWRMLTKDLGFHAGMSLSEVLYHTWAKGQGITNTEWETLYKKITAQPDKALLLLDGYDELTPQQLGITSNLEQAPIVKSLLEAPFYKLLTSRPYGVENIHPQARLEITGFTDDNIKAYIHYYFEDATISQAAYAFMNDNPSIWGVAHIPVTLELLCGTWQENKQQLDEDFTLTRLYHTIITSLLRRYLSNRQREGDKTLQDVGNITDLTVTRLWTLSEPMLRFLSELAQAGLAEGNLIIGPHLIERCRQGKPDAILRDALVSGLLKGTDPGKTAAQQAVYFIHLTFQEFLTAYVLTGPLMSPDKSVKRSAVQALKAIQYAPRYQVVVWFCAGLWDLPSNLSPWPVNPHSHRFWKVLQQPPRDISLVYDASLFVRCIEEAAQTRKTAQSPKQYREAIAFVTRLLTGFAKKAQKLPQGFIRALALCPHFMADHGFAAQWQVYTANLQPRWFAREETRRDIRTTLRYTWSSLGTGLRRCDHLGGVSLVSALKDVEWEVRASAVQALASALGCVLPHLNPVQQAQALPALLQAMGDSDEWVRKHATEALGSAFPHLNPAQRAQALPALLQAIRDPDFTVRQDAAQAVGNEFPHLNLAQQEQALQNLLQAIRDSNHRVQQAAAQSLWCVFPRLSPAQQEQALQDLLKPMGNFYFDAEAIARALGNVFPHLNPAQEEQVFQALTQAMRDSRATAAAQTLGNVFPHLSPAQQEQTGQTLLQAMGDSSNIVRGSVPQTLGRVFPHLNPPQQEQALTALLRAMGDSDCDVRTSAAKALGKAFPHLNPAQQDQALTTLLKATRDSWYFVRLNTAEALGIGFPHLNPIQQEQPRQALLQAMRDSTISVQRAATLALGNGFPHLHLAQQEQTRQTLLEAMRDSKWLVRYSAIEVLGKAFPHLNPAQQGQVLTALLKAIRDFDREVRDSATQALKVLPLQQLMAYHFQSGLPTKVLEEVFIPAAWEAQCALVIDAGHLLLHRPQDLTPEQRQAPTGLSALLQGRLSALKAAFQTAAGL